MNKKSHFDERKFKLYELISNLPGSKGSKTKKELILLLGISKATFERILYAKIGDKQEISGTNLIRVAEYFDVDPKRIMNIPDRFFIGKIELVR